MTKSCSESTTAKNSRFPTCRAWKCRMESIRVNEGEANEKKNQNDPRCAASGDRRSRSDAAAWERACRTNLTRAARARQHEPHGDASSARYNFERGGCARAGEPGPEDGIKS